METVSDAVYKEESDKIQEVRHSGVWRIVVILTTCLSLFNVGMALVVDGMSWLDTIGITNVLPYKGYWNDMICGAILIMSLVVFLFRTQKSLIGLGLVILGTCYMIFTYFI